MVLSSRSFRPWVVSSNVAIRHPKLGPGALALESGLAEIAKLQQLRALGLPPDLFRDASPTHDTHDLRPLGPS
jgi:hypothetical protein